MKEYINYSIEDFATDSFFIHWVISPDKESIAFWEEYKKNNPSKKETIEEAIFLIQSFRVTEPEVSRERIEKIRTRVFNESEKKRNSKLTILFRWAAIFFALIAISGVAYQLMNNKKVNFAEFEVPVSNSAEIIFADGSKKAINSENSQIIQENAGTIIIDSDTLSLNNNNAANNSIELVTVIMPYGKQTRLQLSDGSVIHINSGSKVSYPVQFSGAKREIYMSGEAYFEVEKDKQKPFIVHTSEMDIHVTGTEFNVSAYSDDYFTQAVLVNGSVEVDRKNLLKRNIQLHPGESLSFNKSTGEISKELVDVNHYTSWIHGYIICEKEPVSVVVKKLERFYNCTIICKESISGITFSGKLDLKENIESVIEALSFASPMEIEINNESV